MGRPQKKFEVSVDPETGCWPWQGHLNKDGYARTGLCLGRSGYSKSYFIHRLTYEALIGEIPEGMVLDHLCRNRACVNPWHLEAVLPVDNVRRGDLPKTNKEAVRNAREKVASGEWTLLQASLELRLDRDTTSAIIRGVSWKDAGGPLTSRDLHGKLTDAEAREIWNARSTSSTRQMADKFGVTTESIRKIWTKETWKRIHQESYAT